MSKSYRKKKIKRNVTRGVAHIQATFNNISNSLEHWHYDTFNAAEGAEDPAFEGTKFLFRNNVKGDVS